MSNNYYIQAVPIIYIRPKPSGSTFSFLEGDEPWQVVNYPDPYIANPPTIGIPALTDPVNPHILMNNNIFGHKWRRTGINGGYYDIFTGEYKLVDGTVTTQIAAFGAGITASLIDHKTGLMWKWTANAITTFTASVANALASTHSGYSDWFMASRPMIDDLASTYGIVGTTSNQWFTQPINLPFNINQTLKSSSYTNSLQTSPNSPTQSHIQYTTGTWTLFRADTTNDGSLLVRWHLS